MPGVGVSILLIAIGAILKFAVSVSGHGFNIQTIGVILIIVGVIGLLLSLIFFGMGSWGGMRSRSRTVEEFDDPDLPAGRRRRVSRRDTTGY